MTSPAPPALAAPRPPWILSAKLDGFGLLGSVAVSWLLYGLWWEEVLSTQALVLLWIFVLHGPHFFATIARTVLDKVELRRRSGMYKRSLLWFLVGPVWVGAGLLLGWNNVVLGFFFFASLWAYHHVIKQHFGFVALYRARNRVFDKRDMLWTRYYLLTSSWIPIVILLTGAPMWLEQVPFLRAAATRIGTDSVVAFLADSRGVLRAVFWTLQVAFVLSRVQRLRKGLPIAWPELLVIGLSVSLSWVVAHGCLERSLDPQNPDPVAAYAIVPIITSYHNIQYHFLLWFYFRRRYGRSTEEHGWAKVLTGNLAVYALCGLAYTAVTIGLEYYDVGLLEAIFTDPTFGQVAVALLWGVSFMHYWVDGKIWKVSQDADLQEVLGFAR